MAGATLSATEYTGPAQRRAVRAAPAAAHSRAAAHLWRAIERFTLPTPLRSALLDTSDCKSLQHGG